MTIKNKYLKNIYEVFIISISIFSSIILGNLVLSLFVKLKIISHEFPFALGYQYLIYKIIILVLFSIILSILLKTISFNKLEKRWIRTIGCILTPFLFSFVYVLVSDNLSQIFMNLSDVINKILELIIIIFIIFGVIFIKPWKGWSNYIIGIIYIPIMYVIQIYFIFIMVGLIFDNWL